MHRRTLIRQTLYVTGALAILPSCLDTAREQSRWTNLSVSAEQEAALSRFCELLLPASAIPGAKEINTQTFILTMINDCYSPEDQKKFEKNLGDFEQWSKKEKGGSFDSLSRDDAKEMLARLDRGDISSENKESLLQFYQTARGLALRHYLNSEAYLTQVAGYNIIPGKYQGCMPV